MINYIKKALDKYRRNCHQEKWKLNKTGAAHTLFLTDASANNSMTWLQGGNVGIGVTPYTSTGLLNLKGSGLALLNDLNGQSNNWSVIQNQATLDESSIDFIAGQGLAMTIAHDRNVGIGTTSPSEKLEVAGNVILDADNANIKIKSGVAGTKGDIQWTFNSDSPV